MSPPHAPMIGKQGPAPIVWSMADTGCHTGCRGHDWSWTVICCQTRFTAPAQFTGISSAGRMSARAAMARSRGPTKPVFRLIGSRAKRIGISTTSRRPARVKTGPHGIRRDGRLQRVRARRSLAIQMRPVSRQIHVSECCRTTGVQCRSCVRRGHISGQRNVLPLAMGNGRATAVLPQQYMGACGRLVTSCAETRAIYLGRLFTGLPG